jgi:[ribosomal protein S18]-alanine N-acetyltransferase
LAFTKDSVVVSEGREHDFPALARIQQECPETAQWPLGDYFGFPLLVAHAGSSVAGFCSWRQSTEDEAEILNIAVDPVWRRRGIASALLTSIFERAKGTIFLEVAEHNEAALALYRKLGCIEVGLRRGYYDQGATNAVVMKKSSC